MAEIITLAQAKMAAKLDASLTLDDTDLQLRLDAAHTRVLGFIDNGSAEWHTIVTGWDAASAPNDVKAGILALFTYSVRFRGDDGESAQPPLPPALLPDAVRLYVQHYRDYSVA